MKIAYVGGYWATNIGNSFYDLGIISLLTKIYGKDNVYFVNDISAWVWNVKNDYQYLEYLDVDLVLFGGPILNAYLYKYQGLFDKLSNRNINFGFISAGASKYTLDERDETLQLLNRFRKNISYICTRDTETYLLYEKSGFNVFNGLCGSMFLNDAVNPASLTISPFVTYSFSYFNEPHLTLIGDGIVVHKPNIFNRDKMLGDYKVVRTSHATFSRHKYAIYNRDNMFYSDIPYGYLSIYKNSSIVFSDRVHACAAALVFGAKVMFIRRSRRSKDGRSKLFDRINLSDIYNQPTSLDMNLLLAEKDKMKNFISDN